MAPSATLAMEITGTTAGIGGYDQIRVSGNVTLAGTLDLTMLSGLTQGNTVTLIDNIGTSTATEGYFSEIITSGFSYLIGSSSKTYMFSIGSTEYLLPAVPTETASTTT